MKRLGPRLAILLFLTNLGARLLLRVSKWSGYRISHPLYLYLVWVMTPTGLLVIRKVERELGTRRLGW